MGIPQCCLSLSTVIFMLPPVARMTLAQIRTVTLSRIVKAIFGTLFALYAAVPAHAAHEQYRFSPVNQYGIALTAQYWNPILSYLHDKTGIGLTLKIGRTSADTTAYVLANEVEFVFSNHLFSPERQKLGWRVIARRDTPPVTGEIVVPADSPITSLSQLSGKLISYAGPEALIGYKMPQAALIARGINVTTVFAGNQDAALTQLFVGKVQATGSNAQLVAGYAARENKSYRVLWSTPPVQDLAWFVSSSVNPQDANAIRNALVGMTDNAAGREILRKVSELVGLTKTTGFVSSNGSEYVTERKFYETAPPELR